MFKRILTASALIFSLATNTHAVEVGATAPAFSLPTMKNSEASTLSLDAYKGKVVYVDFWASWCGPCRKSLPVLNKMRAQLHEKGAKDKFEVLAINIDENKSDALDFLAKYPVDYPILADPKAKTPEKYALKGMPTAYLIDKTGKVQYVHEGFDGGIEEIEFMIKKYLD